MELNEYQEKAMSTCMDSCNNFSYMFINLVGEIGEFASKLAKEIRKDHLFIGGKYEGGLQNILNINPDNLPPLTLSDELKKEAGDILWQLSGLCSVMGWNLEDVAQKNLDKLASRKKRGVIDGSGDNR